MEPKYNHKWFSLQRTNSDNILLLVTRRDNYRLFHVSCPAFWPDNHQWARYSYYKPGQYLNIKNPTWLGLGGLKGKWDGVQTWVLFFFLIFEKIIELSFSSPSWEFPFVKEPRYININILLNLPCYLYYLFNLKPIICPKCDGNDHISMTDDTQWANLAARIPNTSLFSLELGPCLSLLENTNIKASNSTLTSYVMIDV